ncbi:MAG: PLP-dependent aminotransferase family protein [Lachnospiraceae bacterium]|nr:PLP-dependent aminotransferase family protein [Lachnospiraceae bacterium]MDD6182535.1 PLP-dependent aminotransferase family protein [Lachnospiraceae bacterium]MDD7378459.1 PLP-dependent aminotransferase family protein [Lachnospiraceae bacterium]MDY4616455.1 PLP-dependent aminotransferase family protein [Lachnospiraceae bacterium]MDY5775047.1 PLP-dependent aminotransferase family protein [Lachnospiraceae bacterium]
MNEIMISLSHDEKTPLYQQIYEHIKGEIIDGRISCGEKLPSTRFLAGYLQVSRSTVELAYEQLVSEGYIEAKPYRGYFVCDVSDLYDLEITLEEEPKTAKKQKPEQRIDFSPNEIDLEHFAFNAWRKVNKNMLSEDSGELFRAGEGAGEPTFREAICNYLYQSRGVVCTPDRIIVGAGNEYLLMLLAQILGEGRTVAMESPTYMQAYQTFCNLGYQVCGIAMDKQGMDVAKLQQEKADIVYVMPSHQFPMGTVMPLKRRMELLKWAEAKDAYIIEDDHDSEFRYKGKPIPSLQGADKKDRVIYLGTFSRSIAPAIRVSYMVLPKHLMKVYRERCSFYASTVPRTQQMALAAFMQEGHFERHLNKMRSIYRKKHDFLMEELKKRNWVRKIYGDNAGMHVLVEVNSKFTDEELRKLALGIGIRIYPLSEYDILGEQKTEYPMILLGYGSLSEEEIKTGLEELDKIIAFF